MTWINVMKNFIFDKLNENDEVLERNQSRKVYSRRNIFYAVNDCWLGQKIKLILSFFTGYAVAGAGFEVPRISCQHQLENLGFKFVVEA